MMLSWLCHDEVMFMSNLGACALPSAPPALAAGGRGQGLHGSPGKMHPPVFLRNCCLGEWGLGWEGNEGGWARGGEWAKHACCFGRAQRAQQLSQEHASSAWQRAAHELTPAATDGSSLSKSTAQTLVSMMESPPPPQLLVIIVGSTEGSSEWYSPSYSANNQVVHWPPSPL